MTTFSGKSGEKEKKESEKVPQDEDEEILPKQTHKVITGKSEKDMESVEEVEEVEEEE